jgi:hypothetical protein
MKKLSPGDALSDFIASLKDSQARWTQVFMICDGWDLPDVSLGNLRSEGYNDLR